MSLDPRTPVLVGVGFAERRCEDPSEALESVALMAEALECAEEDAGARGLLARADRIAVPRGFWLYPDPGRLLADRFGASSATTILAEVGVLQQTLITDACRTIAAGESQVALVTGGDAKYRSLRAEIAGIELSDTRQSGVVPDHTWRAEGALWAAQEWACGLGMPVGFYALMENALRHHQGLGVDAHRDDLARLYAGFSRIAAGNPHAWKRTPVDAATIRNPSAKNPMLAYPYSKLHTSSWNVDQAAGLLFCSVELAERVGISRDRWVFPLACTESNHMLPVAARAELYRCPAVEIAGGRALELAGIEPSDLTHVELYSCFPVAVRLMALGLGLSLERPLTVTGGMPFAGGPLNNYVFQATARMGELLRRDPAGVGIVSSVSGMLTKQGFGLWSCEPPVQSFRSEDLTEAVARATATRPLVDARKAAGIIAGYTVLHAGGEPSRGVAVCDLDDGTRAVAFSDDVALASAMTCEEFCGRAVVLSADAEFCAG